jgi:hypothetical protein
VQCVCKHPLADFRLEARMNHGERHSVAGVGLQHHLVHELHQVVLVMFGERLVASNASPVFLIVAQKIPHGAAIPMKPLRDLRNRHVVFLPPHPSEALLLRSHVHIIGEGGHKRNRKTTERAATRSERSELVTGGRPNAQRAERAELRTGGRKRGANGATATRGASGASGAEDGVNKTRSERS